MDAKSIDKIKCELEALTLEAPQHLEVKLDASLTQSGDVAIDDMRRISSQNYSSTALSDVFKRAKGVDAAGGQVDHVSVSTQESAQNRAFAEMFSSGDRQDAGNPFDLVDLK